MSEGDRPKTIEEYAALQVALARGPREEVLRARGIDEDDLVGIEAEFDKALDEAMNEDGEGVPALLTAFDAGLRKARNEPKGGAPAEDVLSLEEFARLTRALESGRDTAQVFSSRGVTFEKYMRASEHWTPKLASDLELSQRFMALRKR